MIFVRHSHFCIIIPCCHYPNMSKKNKKYLINYTDMITMITFYNHYNRFMNVYVGSCEEQAVALKQPGILLYIIYKNIFIFQAIVFFSWHIFHHCSLVIIHEIRIHLCLCISYLLLLCVTVNTLNVHFSYALQSSQIISF